MRSSFIFAIYLLILATQSALLGYKDQCLLDIDCREPDNPDDVNKCCALLIYEAEDGNRIEERQCFLKTDVSGDAREDLIY